MKRRTTASPPAYAGGSHNARSLALHILLECRQGDAFAQTLLDHQLSDHNLSAADRRLCTQMVYTVLRRRSSLDALLKAVVARPQHQVESWLWEVLRLGACQQALLTHIPAHAAIHATVELAVQYQKPRARGFINGVLRALSRLLTGEQGTQPAADMLPLEAGSYRRLAKGVLPDPATSPVEYVAVAFALPRWLVEHWHQRFGWDALLQLGFWFASPAPLWLRCNTLRTDRASLLQALEQAGIRAEPGDHPQAIRLSVHAAIRELPGYDEGWFSVQDESAMNVASALAPQPGFRVLDMCAAPGGKTTHLAELMQNQGQIIACDVDVERLQTVASLSRRLGINIIETRQVTPQGESSSLGGQYVFDAALVDVPCSNTGVLGRRPEARWRLNPQDLQRLLPLQTRLLIEAMERVRPGGAVVYSTCSIEPEENQGVVRNVLKALKQWELEAEQEQSPGRPADGGYWARLRRRGG